MDDARPAEGDIELTSAKLAKTKLGREQFGTRTLRLSPLQRRVLVLADGQRDLRTLAEMMPGQDVLAAARELLQLDCLVVQASEPPAAAPAAEATTASLPPASGRSPEQVEMARNFMINTINTLLPLNSRLTLVRQIFESRGAEELRQHLDDWETAIASSWVGKKRLPELKKKLFAVL